MASTILSSVAHRPQRLAAPVLLALLLAVAGCNNQEASQQGPAATAGAAPAAELTLCTDPRPEMCTMDYNPVCGSRDDGSRKTYSNGCSACSDSAVTGWTMGACE